MDEACFSAPVTCECSIGVDISTRCLYDMCCVVLARSWRFGNGGPDCLVVDGAQFGPVVWLVCTTMCDGNVQTAEGFCMYSGAYFTMQHVAGPSID